MFRRAMQLDQNEAWQTLADEVAVAVSEGGPVGVNLHTIELLASVGDLNDSVAAWNAACDAIAYRIPPTSPMDAPEVEYGSIQLSGDVAIAAFTIARMNNFDIHQRRQAMASLASLIAAEPTVVGAAVAAILGDAPESVRTTVISLIHEFEQPPYQLTKALQPVLHSLASAANSLSARVFARLLLERAALDAPQPGPSGIPGVVRLSEPALSFTRGAFGSARLAPIEALWPDYGDLAAAALDSNMKSKQHKAQMEAMRDSLGNRAIVFDSRLWWPIDEEIEGALQSTALGLRSAMAMLGQIGSDLEWEPARHLVGDVNIGVRIAMSRTPRPHYYERPDEFPEFAVGKALTVSGDGRYNGWVVLGHRERQLQLAAGFDRKVAAQHDVSSGIVYAGSGEIQRAHGSLPFAAGDGTAWLTPTHSAARVPIHKGPVVAMDIQRDPFGVVEVLSPTPVVRRAASVSPVRPLGGLILTNGSGEPVIVGRCWREPLLENEYVNDRVFEFVGVELIARPDVLDAVGRLTLTGAEYITVHFETNRSEP